jgi:putative glutathione S-transferase
LRNWVTPDGEPGPSGRGGFKAEPGRYHLYVSYACPWAHRAIIYRSLLGLEDAISMSVVNPINLGEGWDFGDYPGATKDEANGAQHLHEVYTRAEPDFTGKVTVPTLWDRKTGTVVNNESSEIIRMMGDAFREIATRWRDLYPDDLAPEIDALNAVIYKTVNNGVYRCGFARSQAAYTAAVTALFETLDQLEARLDGRRYLLGDRMTEADWRLFTTLVRFDLVYYGHFKCNLRRLEQYENLWAYTRDLYHHPGVAETVRFDHIKDHYYGAQLRVNPSGIIPIGPRVDFDQAPAPRQKEGVAGC